MSVISVHAWYVLKVHSSELIDLVFCMHIVMNFFCYGIWDIVAELIFTGFFSILIFVAKKTMWERLTAPEDVFSKLQRENMAIIESYGAALMEVVCRDACDGHEIGRVK